MKAIKILFCLIIFLIPFPKALGQQGDFQKKERAVSFHFGAGYTNFTFNETSQESIIVAHNNQWRNTNNYDLGILYHHNKKWTFGIQGSQLSAYAVTENLLVATPTDTFAGFLEDDIILKTMTVFGEGHLLKKENYSLGLTGGLDYFYYQNYGNLIVDEFLLEGGGFALRFGGFFDLQLSRRISLNFKGQYISSTLRNPSYQAVNPQIPILVENQDLSRMEFNIGLRISLLRKARSNSKNSNDDDNEYVPNPRFD